MQLRGDEVVLRRFPCLQCSVGVLCEACRGAAGVRRRVVVDTVEPVEEEDEDEEEVEEEIDDHELGNSDEGDASGDGDESEDDDEEEEEGDSIVWAPFRWMNL